jgi:nicotinamidase-related amidase
VAQPKTLLEMAGARLKAPSLDSVAVVLIDMQMEYVDGHLALPNAEPAIAEAARLLRRARDAHRPVIHIQHKGQAGGLFDPGGPGFALAPAVAPLAGEPVINKTLPNSFARTDLDAVLKGAGVRQVVFAGFMTHMCVSSTVRCALDLGYSATVIASACATRDLPDGQGGVVAADTVHRAELAALADRFAIVVPDCEALTKRAT